MYLESIECVSQVIKIPTAKTNLLYAYLVELRMAVVCSVV